MDSVRSLIPSTVDLFPYFLPALLRVQDHNLSPSPWSLRTVSPICPGFSRRPGWPKHNGRSFDSGPLPDDARRGRIVDISDVRETFYGMSRAS